MADTWPDKNTIKADRITLWCPGMELSKIRGRYRIPTSEISYFLFPRKRGFERHFERIPISDITLRLIYFHGVSGCLRLFIFPLVQVWWQVIWIFIPRYQIFWSFLKRPPSKKSTAINQQLTTRIHYYKQASIKTFTWRIPFTRQTYKLHFQSVKITWFISRVSRTVLKTWELFLICHFYGPFQWEIPIFLAS